MNPPTRPTRRIDGHVHLIGDGSAGDGCWMQIDGPKMRIQRRVLLHAAGLSTGDLAGGLDHAYRKHLRQLVASSSLDAVLLLAQDLPHDDSGRPLRDKAVFYVPNAAVLALAAESPDLFVPAVSIHPARPDALDELDRCAAAGARVLKLLPNVLNVDCNRLIFRPFWQKMATLKMCFLAHTGGEYSLPVLRRDLENPSVLKAPLEAGVTCIAAHGAGRSDPWGRDYTDALLTLMDRYPHLYTDNSALSTPNRAHTAPHLLRSRHLDRVIHGSDFPIPVGTLGPRLHRLISSASARAARSIFNPLERDASLKTAMGFPPATFTRLSSIIAQIQP